LYYARYPGWSSVFGVPVGGGPEQLILERAINPQPLSDGTLLVVRRTADGSHHILRYWPNDGREQTLAPDIAMNVLRFSFRAFSDEREVVFWKQPSTDAADAVVPLCALHL